MTITSIRANQFSPAPRIAAHNDTRRRCNNCGSFEVSHDRYGSEDGKPDLRVVLGWQK
jgi:hypothetical protein